MVGVVRRTETARSRLGELEVSAIALELAGMQVILCGVDTLAIQAPEVDDLRARISAATSTPKSGIVLNWNHTHHAPPGGRTVYGSFGEADGAPDPAVIDYIDLLHQRIVDVCKLACERLEPAWVRWGLGFADVAVNRRERDDDGTVRDIGWNDRGMVDTSVPVLQTVRPDGSAIATVVSFGCHTVTTGIEFIGYSPDYPGPLRQVVRDVTGGECVFLQGAGGNVMPRFAFDDECLEPGRMGRRLALEALHATRRPACVARTTRRDELRIGYGRSPLQVAAGGSRSPATRSARAHRRLPAPPTAFRRRCRECPGQRGAGDRRGHRTRGKRVRAPGSSLSRPQLGTTSRGRARLRSAPDQCLGADRRPTDRRRADRHRPRRDLHRDRPCRERALAGRCHAVCRLHERMCLLLPDAKASIPGAAYEPLYGNKTYGLPVQVSPECDRILVQTGAELACSLFPEREPPPPGDWKASGNAPPRLPATMLRRPPRG